MVQNFVRGSQGTRGKVPSAAMSTQPIRVMISSPKTGATCQRKIKIASWTEKCSKSQIETEMTPMKNVI